jgi:hypothetical protein
VGVESKAGVVVGSFDRAGRFVSNPSGFSETDLEQDVFGAVRVLRGGQVSVLVPFVETRRTSAGLTDFGGGLGDVNMAARYDFVEAGASRFVPGIALLAGLTVPTGKPPDAANLGPLDAGATGIGAVQINAGLALEQVFGPWLVNVAGIAAQRTARTVGSAPEQVHERLGTQWTFLAALAYTFPNDWAAAATASYSVEGDATIDGASQGGTAHRLPTLTISGLLPIDDVWRLEGGASLVPPIGSLGLNQPASAGLFATLVRSWI